MILHFATCKVPGDTPPQKSLKITDFLNFVWFVCFFGPKQTETKLKPKLKLQLKPKLKPQLKLKLKPQLKPQLNPG